MPTKHKLLLCPALSQMTSPSSILHQSPDEAPISLPEGCSYVTKSCHRVITKFCHLVLTELKLQSSSWYVQSPVMPVPVPCGPGDPGTPGGPGKPSLPGGPGGP